jgi:hypothetical protein
LPFYGYVLPSAQHAITNKRAAAIVDFVREISAGKMGDDLRPFAYFPAGPVSDWLIDVRVETDLDERPILRRLLEETNLGTIVVPYRDDLYAVGQGPMSLQQERAHARLLEDIVNKMVPVVSLNGRYHERRHDPLMRLIRGSERAAYFAIADNYADNRHRIESHVQKILQKPREPA